MEFFEHTHAVAAIREIQKLMTENKDYLIELDAAIGDGDLGLTMAKGFTAALETATSIPDKDLGVFFKKVGLAIAKTVPSTMGTLMATALMGAGKSAENNMALNAGQIAKMFESMAEAVSQRGKAKEG